MGYVEYRSGVVSQGDGAERLESLDLPAPEVLRLAQLLSFATLADPGLIRQMRLKFLPESDAGIEADLWFLPIVQHAGADGIVFEAEASKKLRHALANTDPQCYEAAWAATHQAHRVLSPAIRLEEEIGYLAYSLHTNRNERMQQLFRSAIAALRDPARSGLAHWAARALPRFPSEVRNSEGALMLAAGASFRLSGTLATLCLLPKEEVSEWGAWLAPDGLQTTLVALRLHPGVLEIGPPKGDPEEELIELPKTEPLCLEVGDVVGASTVSDKVAKKRKIFISYQQKDAKYAKVIYNSLKRFLGSETEIFLDSASISSGGKVTEIVKATIAEAAIFLALVGPSSSTPRYREKELSFFQTELAIAFKRGVRVLPVLIGGAKLRSDLPSELARYQAIEIGHESYQDGMVALTEEVRLILANAKTSQEKEVSVNFQSIHFNEGETRRVLAHTEMVRLRTVVGDEYLLMLIGRALDQAVSNTDEKARLEELSSLVPKLTGELLKKAVQAAQLFRDDLLRVKMLCALSLQVSPQEREAILRDVLEQAQTMQGLERRLEMLVTLAPYVPERSLVHLFQTVIKKGDSMPDTSLVSRLSPYLPKEVLKRYFPTLTPPVSVYLSSSHVDLAVHRKAVVGALSEFATVIGHEYVGATPMVPLELSLDLESRADIYLGIFANNYGYIPPSQSNPDGVSITEMELRYARKLGKQCFIFLADNASIGSAKPLTDNRMQQLRDHLLKEYVVEFFSTPDDLAFKASRAVKKIATNLHKTMDQNESGNETAKKKSMGGESALRETVDRLQAQVLRVSGKSWEMLIQSSEYMKAATELNSLSASMGELANALSTTGKVAEALSWAEKCILIDQSLGESGKIATSHASCARILLTMQKYEKADAHLRQALEGARQSVQKNLEAEILLMLGSIANVRNEFDIARLFFQEALVLFEQMGNFHDLLQGYILLGVVEQKLRNFLMAQELFIKAKNIAESIQNHAGLGKASLNLASLLLEKSEAEGNFVESPDLRNELEDVTTVRLIIK